MFGVRLECVVVLWRLWRLEAFAMFDFVWLECTGSSRRLSMDDSCARTARFKLSRKVKDTERYWIFSKAAQVCSVCSGLENCWKHYQLLQPLSRSSMSHCVTHVTLCWSASIFHSSRWIFQQWEDVSLCLTLQTLWSSESGGLVGPSMLKLKNTDSLSLENPSIIV